MMDVYDAPQLANFYCSKICPLGKKTVQPRQMLDFDRMMLQTISALSDATTIRERIIEIASDGDIQPNEKPIMKQVISYLERLATATEEMRIWAMKNMKEEGR